MTAIQEQAKKVMDSLNKSVDEALEKKRRLGQYAVIWQDGKIVRTLADDTPPDESEQTSGASRDVSSDIG